MLCFGSQVESADENRFFEHKNARCLQAASSTINQCTHMHLYMCLKTLMFCLTQKYPGRQVASSTTRLPLVGGALFYGDSM